METNLKNLKDYEENLTLFSQKLDHLLKNFDISCLTTFSQLISKSLNRKSTFNWFEHIWPKRNFTSKDLIQIEENEDSVDENGFVKTRFYLSSGEELLIDCMPVFRGVKKND